MRRIIGVMLAVVLYIGGSATAQEAAETDAAGMTAQDRIGYAVGYELGRRLSERGMNVSPEQVAAGIREGNAGADALSDEVPGVGFRLGQMIAARGLDVSPSIVAEAIKDGMTGNVALLDAQARGAALAQATAGPYAKIDTQVDAQVDGRADEAPVTGRSGFGLWSTPGLNPAAGQAGTQQEAGFRVESTGRIDAQVSSQQVQGGVAGTAANNEEVDAYEPIVGGQGSGGPAR